MKLKTITNCLILGLTLILSNASIAQNPKIKCYFNHPVNTLLSSGTNAVYLKTSFPDTIVAYINRAKFTLDFAIYNFTSISTDSVAKIATAVNNAYKRGVQIRWINDGASSNKGMSLLDTAIPRISSPTSGSYGIMHNKFLVIDANSKNQDDAYVISGSCNYSEQQALYDYNNLIIVQDQNFASAYYDQFNQMWGGSGPQPDTTASLFGTRKKISKKRNFIVGGTPLELYFSPKDTCGEHFKSVANSADNDLTFGIYTFTDNNIATIFLNKYNANIQVRGIMDKFSKTYSPYTTLLGPLGKNMAVYSNSKYLYHNKILIVDALKPSSDPQVATGSFNWSNAAETLNDENLIIIHDSTIANQYYQSVCQNITENGGNGCIIPLPVEWESFTANQDNPNSIALHWVISNPKNQGHFEIEKSHDGINFEYFGKVTAEDINYRGNNAYSFIDNQPLSGTNYYRIKQVDNDGSFTYSKTITLFNRTTGSLEIYPNPTQGKLQINLPLNAASFSIYNILGSKIASGETKQQTSLDINIASFSKGIYYVEIQSKGDRIVKKIVKE